MRTLPLSRRFAIVLFAIVQMAAPALASVGDARLLARNDRVASQSHAEDHTRRSCAAVHPDDCALCQFLSHLAPEGCGGPALPVVERQTAQIRERGGRWAFAEARGPDRSRAPPVG